MAITPDGIRLPVMPKMQRWVLDALLRLLTGLVYPVIGVREGILDQVIGISPIRLGQGRIREHNRLGRILDGRTRHAGLPGFRPVAQEVDARPDADVVIAIAPRRGLKGVVTAIGPVITERGTLPDFSAGTQVRGQGTAGAVVLTRRALNAMPAFLVRAGHHIWCRRHVVPVVIGIHRVGEIKLAQVARAVGPAGRFPCRRERATQHAGQDADDGDHHQQFD